MKSKPRRKPGPSPLTIWRDAHVLAPAAAIFAKVRKGRVQCPECDGTGESFDYAGRSCRACQGFGYDDGVELTGARRRKIIDRDLRAAGLDPAAFDDEGRLIEG